MRDLRRHPVTLVEIRDCLMQLCEDISREQSPGDMRPLLLSMAADIMMRAGFTVHGVKI